MSAQGHKVCKRCVIDTSDPDIFFDNAGVCNHCRHYDEVLDKKWLRGVEGEQALDKLWKEIKKAGEGKEYDCILGLSGGIDSAYLAYISKNAGLRILAVHVDAGWNSEAAVSNIQNICTGLNLDLVTEVIDWSAMQKVQRAFLKSRVINQDIPQDHAFFASLYRYAMSNNITYVLNGSNIASESILPLAWRGYHAMDSVHIKDIYRKHTPNEKLKGFPLLHLFRHLSYFTYMTKLKIVTPLNFLDYNKAEAIVEMGRLYHWKNPGEKHYESRFTRFHQRYNLFEKFGIDERKAHFSSLILAGQMTREEAIERLKILPYSSSTEREQDIDYVCKKLDFKRTEFEEIMARPNGRHEDYKSSQVSFNKIYPIVSKFTRFLKK